MNGILNSLHGFSQLELRMFRFPALVFPALPREAHDFGESRYSLVYPYGGFLSHNHPNFTGIFQYFYQPAIGDPPFVETSI